MRRGPPESRTLLHPHALVKKTFGRVDALGETCEKPLPVVVVEPIKGAPEAIAAEDLGLHTVPQHHFLSVLLGLIGSYTLVGHG